MTGAGYAWIKLSSVNQNPTLLYLQGFDALFLAGDGSNNATLIDHVNAGGNVFLEGGISSEAANWDAFLNAFGLSYVDSFNNIVGNIPISSSNPLFTGVSVLYQNNGNDILDLSPSDLAQVLITCSDTQGTTHGLYAIYDSTSGPSAVPEPTSLLLLGTGLGGLALAAWRRRK